MMTDAKPGAVLGFFRGGGRIFKKFSKVLTTFFLGRPNCFSEKTGQKAVFRHFLKNFDKKIEFFWRALPLKVSIYWHQRRL